MKVSQEWPRNYLSKIIPKSLPEKYIFENGGRDYLLDKSSLSIKDIRVSANEID